MGDDATFYYCVSRKTYEDEKTPNELTGQLLFGGIRARGGKRDQSHSRIWLGTKYEDGQYVAMKTCLKKERKV